MSMSGILTHTQTIDEKAKARLEELAPTLQAIKWIDRNIGAFEAYIERVVEILHSRISTFAWVGYYWVQPSGLVLIASRGVKENEQKLVGIRKGAIGRAAALGEAVSDKGRGIFQSEISVPVERGGVVTAVIAVKSEHPMAFGHEHVMFLERVASEVAARWLV